MEDGHEELHEGAQVTPTLKLVSRIGAGGMGSVWVAEHQSLETRVAVKFIAHYLAGNAQSAARFKREAAAAASVKSPHVVQVLDYGVTTAGTPFIVMELLEGKDLRARIGPGNPVPPRETTAIVRQVARALGRAHELGIVHRDVKPENVFLCQHDDDEPFVKVLDFGVAKRESEGHLTTTGTTVGTPYYMSPEQLVGAKTVDARSDLWAVGVMTFYMLTGKRPFGGETAAAVAVSIHNGTLPMPTKSNPKLPPAIDAWFAKACARDPNDRFQTAKELATMLARALESTPSAAFDALEVTMPASAQPVSSQPTQREVVRRVVTRPSDEAPSSAAMSASSAKLVTARSNRSTRVAWAVAGVAVLALGFVVVRTQMHGGDAPRTQASPSPTTTTTTTTNATTATETETASPTPTNAATTATTNATTNVTTASAAPMPKPILHPLAPHVVPSATASAKPTSKPTTTTPPSNDDLPALK